MNLAEPIAGCWDACNWVRTSDTLVVVTDPAVATGIRAIAECADGQTARLLAETPALLAALQAMLHEFGRTYLPGSSPSVDAARAVLGRVGIECPVPQVGHRRWLEHVGQVPVGRTREIPGES